MLLPNSGANIAHFGAFRLHLAYRVSSFGDTKTGDLLYFFHIYLIRGGEEVFLGFIGMPNTPVPDVMYWLEQRLARERNVIQELSTFNHLVTDPSALLGLLSADQPPLTKEAYTELKRGAGERVDEAMQLYQEIEQEMAVLHSLYPNTSANDARIHRLGEFSAPPFSRTIMRTLSKSGQAHERETLATKFVLAPKTKTYGLFTLHPLLQRFNGDGEEPMAYYAILLEADSTDPVEVGVMGIDESDRNGTEQRIALCLAQFDYSIQDFQTLSNSTETLAKKDNILMLVDQWKKQRDIIELARPSR